MSFTRSMKWKENCPDPISKDERRRRRRRRLKMTSDTVIARARET